MFLTIAGYNENISKNSVKCKCIHCVKSKLFSKAGLHLKKSKFQIIIDFFWKYSKLSTWKCIESWNKKNFGEMIFHFLLKNDLFNWRGQKMFPIHFYNYIHWDTFLTSFILFVYIVQLTHSFIQFFCTIVF